MSKTLLVHNLTTIMRWMGQILVDSLENEE